MDWKKIVLMSYNILRKIGYRTLGIRLRMLALVLAVSVKMFGVGWTPTDCGLVVNFSAGDQFLLSVWIDENSNGVEDPGEEYFVCDYPSHTGGRFTYEAGKTLKLIPQDPIATAPSPVSVWTVDSALTRPDGKNTLPLGGVSYTMWSNTHKTLVTDGDFKFLGSLADDGDGKNKYRCDVVFAVPTNQSTDADPANTLRKATIPGAQKDPSSTPAAPSFDGAMGTGFLGMTYREVYWFDIPRQNNPNTYINAALVTFNTTLSTQKWGGDNPSASNNNIVKPGQAAYAYADTKHNRTTRTIFRLYVLGEKKFVSSPLYFFGWNVQDYKRYRQTNTLTDFGEPRKIYYLDHFEPMKREGTSEIYKTGNIKVPQSDSAYYYVGYNNDYRSGSGKGEPLGASTAVSKFRSIKELRVKDLAGADQTFSPAPGASGKMVVDTTSAAENLGVTFQPAGYFFRTSSGLNVSMRQVDETTWITEQMWHIEDEYMALKGIVLLYTGEKFSGADLGAKIINWSDSVLATDIPVYGEPGETAAGKYGWARIHTDNPAKNGGIEFVQAQTDRYVRYDNNRLLGTQIPDQYPMEGGDNKVTIQDAQLKEGFVFLGWAESENGDVVYWTRDSIGGTTLPGGAKFVGDEITLSEAGEKRLYAKGYFDDTYRVAFSFVQDGKRYFLTHPNRLAPRYARVRTFTDWTNVYQGMSDEDNTEPNYLSTYKLIGYPTCELCAHEPSYESLPESDREYVLDPQHETVRGVVDSLTFYENWAPPSDEFIGLYYEAGFDTIIANDTWAGAFKSSQGWPSYNRTAVDNTKLSSSRYFTGMKAQKYSVNNRTGGKDYIKYDAARNQFGGVATPEEGTDFQITGIAVADAYYIILPDTLDNDHPWMDNVVFDYHNEVQNKQVWSKLIGKQLMACLRVGEDTVYFHPNRTKTITTASALRLSNDYRLTQEFTLIHDQRSEVKGYIAVGDSVTMEEGKDGFYCTIYSGASTPVGPTVDIMDTLRVRLRPAAASKIKNYYGRWQSKGNRKAPGLTIAPDGTRYRDIIIKTKTYHYGAEATRLVLEPDRSYIFSPLKGVTEEMHFTLSKQTYMPLLDAAGKVVGDSVLTSVDVTENLRLSASCFTFKSGENLVVCPGDSTQNDKATIRTKVENVKGANSDILTVTIGSITVEGKTYTDVKAVIPVTQASLDNTELVWSVVYNKQRYFIMAETGKFRCQTFTVGSRTVRNGKELFKGSYAFDGKEDRQHITPWSYTYHPVNKNQLSLKTKYNINRYFNVSGETPQVSASDSVFLTYQIIRTNVNTNANYEEIVKLKFGADKWLMFNGTTIVLTPDSTKAGIFSWGYMQKEYYLINDGTYPSIDSLVFIYNNAGAKNVQTRFKAYSDHSMLIDGALTYLCKTEEADYSDLIDSEQEWKINPPVFTRIPDARFYDEESETYTQVSGLGEPSTNTSTLTTTITPVTVASPINVKIGRNYVDIVDTLQMTLTLRADAPAYRFKDWKGVASLSDACLKIPLVRKTYHTNELNEVICTLEGDDYNVAFPATLPKGVDVPEEDSCHTFDLKTYNRIGTSILDVNNNVVASSAVTTYNLTSAMALNNINFAEVRLSDEKGQKPDWCVLSVSDSAVTVKCLKDGIRSPRQAYVTMAYIVTDKSGTTRFVNYRLTVSQQSMFEYANNQILVHSRGITGDDKDALGRQQVHENKRILYYYNPYPYDEDDQNVELPVRERAFYGWWRWYREGKDESGNDVSDMDVPDGLWIDKPRNVGLFNNPFRTIGDMVDVPNPDYDPEKPEESPETIKQLKTMGRYTVFHYPAVAYNAKKDPPSKSPTLKAPREKKTLTYALDLSNYYDNLPLSMSEINQVDQAALDASLTITEPTLSLREIFELHPWTEMADTLEHYKSRDALTYELADEKYLEDHVVMAPVGHTLLLSTEQRYRYDHLKKYNHSESLLGYYMRDDKYSTWTGDKDTMIWCGGWDADCEWYIYNPSSKTYSACSYPVTEGDDFLKVPAKGSITGGDADTVYFCLRARSKSTTVDDKGKETTDDGLYMFNICRYKIIYHDPRKFGPFEEKGTGSAAKAIITNDEIEQNYEVLERLNFDYYQPGKDYHVYEHPLPWADASYGYSYPVGPEIPDNRYHNDFAPNFPGTGEYGIINRIPYSKFWHKMEQHGGAENGFMIYCDGMSSSGQVAALSLSTHLCEGQKMYFSAYVGNPSSQKDKANPSFTFSVQGWDDKAKKWEDITTYMTGDIEPSDQWSQIYFPIEHDKAFDEFRVRIYNMASDFDGNDFIIDDMCVFATKPPLIAYQANTKCVADNDSLIHIVLRVDYQGFIDKNLNGKSINYTVEEIKNKVSSFVPMIDGYFNEEEAPSLGKYGAISMPSAEYYPQDEDSIFDNLSLLAIRFEETVGVWEKWKKDGRVGAEPALFRQGYIFENLDGDIRPVLYTMHKAKMTPDNTYNVRMSLGHEGLLNSQCAMTSSLKVTSRMMLMVNGEEQKEKTVSGLCANSIYDVSMRVRTTIMDIDSVAPVDLTGSCYNDWLLYGDTAEASSILTYGYKYRDIVTVVTNILRYEPNSGESNVNQFARNLGEVNRNVMNNIQKKFKLSSGLNAYDVLADLVNRGLLTLYQSDMYINVAPGESAQYVVFPIVGTGTDDMRKQNMDVCPNPIVITLSPKETTPEVPLILGGIIRNDILASQPIAILADAETAGKELSIRIDYIRSLIGIHAVTLLSTDDPNFRQGVHRLALSPDKVWPRDLGSYYTKGDNIFLRPASSNNYTMRSGYKYTFNFEMTSATDSPMDDVTECPIGDVPMVVAIVPDYLRWSPANKNNDRWNDPMNWIGVTADNTPLPIANRFAPLPSTDVIIPAMPDSLPYPVLQSAIAPADSVKQVGFVYNTCDDIRFLAGSAIRQQQLLTSDVLVVDMRLPQQKWALRSAPVTGLISGDLFMADADLKGETKNWSVGTFDASGRSWSTGNASFWLSLYNQATEHLSREAGDAGYQSISAATEWSKVTNGMTLSLPPAQGWAVYARTASGKEAEIRLPKNDDTYYYYGTYGERLDDRYVSGLRTTRNTYAEGTAGQLAFNPGKAAGHQDYTLTNGVASKMFVFGNPTLGYIDIWGFIADNAANLDETIGYIGSNGIYTTANKESAAGTTDTIIELQRYLPPMHAMVITLKDAVAATCSLAVTLDTSRIVTHPRQVQRPAPSPAPMRNSQLATGNSQLTKGIMTITAVNPVSNRCLSRLLLGQGYDDAIRSGEDAVLTTLNIDRFHMTNTPTTPFNLYAVEGDYGLSIDLRHELLNVPISFYMSQLPYEPVTQLWFTGVNNISGTLVLYDALTDTERPIHDGICLEIETPEASHERRYYIRRRGYTPGTSTDDVPTGIAGSSVYAEGEQPVKIIRNGQVLIIRNGHVYTMVGQQIR